MKRASTKSDGTQIESPPKKLGRRLKLTFSAGHEPELEKIEFRADKTCNLITLENDGAEHGLSFRWGPAAKGLSLLFLDYLCWEGGDRFFRFPKLEKEVNVAVSIGNDRYKETGIANRLFVDDTKAKDKALAGQALKVVFRNSTSVPRAIEIRHSYLPSDCVEIVCIERGSLTKRADRLDLANRIRAASGLTPEPHKPTDTSASVLELHDAKLSAIRNDEQSQPPPDKTNGVVKWPEYLRSSPAAQQALKHYPDKYIERHGQIKVLWMSKPVLLKETFVEAQLVDPTFLRTYACLATVDQTYRPEGRGAISTSEHLPADAYAWANKWQFLNVLGQPGSGKSTFLRRLGLEALLPKKGRKYRHDCVPVFVELNQFKSTQTRLTEMIRRELTACNFPDDFAEHALKNGKLLILLDGIEEVPAENLAHAIGEIRQLVQDYGSNRFITSCRIAFYQSWLPGFTDGFLAGLGDKQIRAYLANWFQADGNRRNQKATEAWAKLSKPKNAGVLELARRPLLLTFICLYYGNNFELPVSFGDLYEEALALLLVKWAREKLPGGKPGCGGLTAKQENHLLEEIAGPTFERDEFFFQKKILENQIDRFLRNELKASGIDGRDVLEAIEVQQGLLEARAGNIYSFSHQTLHEYLASKQFHNQGLASKLAERHFFERRYREVFLLLAEMEDASSMLLAAAKSLGRRIKEEKLFSKLVLWVSNNYRAKSPREKLAERLNAQRDVALLMVRYFNLYSKMQNLPKPESYFQDPLSQRHDKYSGQWNEKWTTISDCLQDKDARDKERLGDGLQAASELYLESFKLSVISRRIENTTESIRNSEDTSFGSFLEKWMNRDTVDLESYFYGCNLLLECKTIAGVGASEWEKIEENLVSFGI